MWRMFPDYSSGQKMHPTVVGVPELDEIVTVLSLSLVVTAFPRFLFSFFIFLGEKMMTE